MLTIFKRKSADFKRKSADFKLVKKYTGIELNDQQLENLKVDGKTLRDTLGSNKKIYNDHHGLGIPGHLGNADQFMTVIDLMANRNVVLDVETTPGLKEKFEKYVHSKLCTDNWPFIPEAYREDKALIEVVKEKRKLFGLEHENFSMA